MNEIESLLRRIRRHKDCTLFPPAGLPTVSDGHILPADLLQFYELCGGGKLFKERDYFVDLMEPSRLRLSNPEILRIDYVEDISDAWYIVAQNGLDQFFTIDLHPERLGRCYDSFWDRHASMGSCPIIARSFTELLLQLTDTEGGYWYWLRPEFKAIGDAYDGYA